MTEVAVQTSNLLAKKNKLNMFVDNFANVGCKVGILRLYRRSGWVDFLAYSGTEAG